MEEFAQASDDMAASIKRRIEENLGAIRAVGAFYSAVAGDVDRSEFQAFVQPLLSSNPSIRAFQWAPRVKNTERAAFETHAGREMRGFEIRERTAQGQLIRARERDEYFPVWYVEPLKETEFALGIDHAAYPPRRAALERARDTGQITASEHAHLPPDNTNGQGLVKAAFQPIYRKGAPVETVEQRRENLLGFVAGVFRVSDTVKESLAYLGDRGVDVYVYERSADGADDLVYFEPSSLPGPRPQSVLDAMKNGPPPSGLRMNRRFYLADQNWSLVFVPAPGMYSIPPFSLPWWVAGVVLLFTAMLAAYLGSSRAHTLRAEHLVGALRSEVEERRHAELEATRSHNFLSAILDTAAALVMVLDREGRIVGFNRACEALTGYTFDEVKGKHLWNCLLPAKEKEMAQEVFRRLVEGGDTRRQHEALIMAKDGSPHLVMWSCASLPDAEELPGYVISTGIDITERRRAEEALHEASQRLRLHLENSPLAVIEWSADLRIVRWTEGARRIFGWSPEEALGKRAEELHLIYEEDRHGFRQAITDMLSGSHPRDVGNSRNYRKDGSVIYCEWYNSVIQEPSGRSAFVLSLVMDVSERTRLEAKLRQQAEQLAEADRRKDEFLAMLGHELRNPLAPIRNAVEVLRMQSGPANPTFQWGMDVIARQTEQLSHLVDDLLDVARITHGRIALRKAPVQLAEIIAQAVETTRPLIEARRQNLTFSLTPIPIQLLADPARLAQVISNLLNNAAKYTPEGGRIELIALAEGHEAVITVRDTGVGIPPQILPHIFDLFIQANRSLDRSEGGLGLGLSLVRNIVEMHGGHVQAASAGPGRGSEFTVRLPILAAGAPTAPAAAAAPSHSDAPHRRILVVDDNPDVARSFTLLLETLGHEVQTVYSGAEALIRVREFHPEVVFLDIGLPGMNGYEVARRLRSEHQQALRLIALTGYGREDDRCRATEAGFDHYLLKPVAIEALEVLLAPPN